MGRRAGTVAAMVKDSRKGLLFGVGLLVGIAAGAVGMMSLRGGDGPYAGSPIPSTRSMGAAPASTAFVTAVAGNCEMAPVLPHGGDGDGREALQAKPSAASAGDVASLILAGKEAAAAGRNRDAEIDFLNACRNAATLQDGDPIPLSDAMYQLGRHYANVGALGGAAKGQELFRRAERLYSASLEGFRARYGEDHEKTRFAREGLVTVQQATGGKAPKVIAKAAPAPAASAPVASASAAPATAAASAPLPATAAASAPAPVVATAPAPATPPARRPVAKARPQPAPQEAAAPAWDPSRADAQAARDARRDAAPVRNPRVQDESAQPDRPAVATDEARPRPQARRAPMRERTQPEEMAVEEPAPRRMRPAPIYPPPAEQEPPPLPSDYSSSGAGPAVPTAEGSPNAP